MEKLFLGIDPSTGEKTEEQQEMNIRLEDTLEDFLIAFVGVYEENMGRNYNKKRERFYRHCKHALIEQLEDEMKLPQLYID